MKIYKTNQASINKGVLKEVGPNCTYTIYISSDINSKTVYELINERGNKLPIIIKIDNRIKGYCLKEVK